MLIKNKKYFIFFIITFLFVFCYSYFVSRLYGDEIWNYGFAYNISNGMIPYRDFNLVITPLYSMLASFFINIFGHHLYSLHIFNCLILSLMICIIYFKIGKKGIILFPLILLNNYPNYNIFSVFLIILLFVVLDNDIRRQDDIVALLVSLLFLTKQTVGICLFIPMIYYSRNKLKSFAFFSIPILVFFIYLLSNEALYDFINYCFLGLFDFGTSNGIYLFLPLEILICFIIIFYLVKSKFTNKSLFYLLMFQIITIPIVDDYHFLIGLLPVLYYYLLIKNIVNYRIKYYFIIVCFFCFLWNFGVRSYEIGYLYSDSNSYLYGRNISKNVEQSITKLGTYINSVRDEYDYIYFFSANAYYVKLNIEYKISKFDLINDGNMGYNGSVKYIEEIHDYCSNNRCMFILYEYEFKNDILQTNRDIVNYVVNNYPLKEVVQNFRIYINY